MNRVERGIKIARDAALMSVQKYRVGAAIFLGKHLVSIGWNSRKTSPNNNSIFKWHHAETSALVGTGRLDLSGASIFVVRLTRRGWMGISKPCKPCMDVITAAGISTTWFIGGDGKPYKLNL